MSLTVRSSDISPAKWRRLNPPSLSVSLACTSRCESSKYLILIFTDLSSNDFDDDVEGSGCPGAVVVCATSDAVAVDDDAVAGSSSHGSSERVPFVGEFSTEAGSLSEIGTEEVPFFQLVFSNSGVIVIITPRH